MQMHFVRYLSDLLPRIGTYTFTTIINYKYATMVYTLANQLLAFKLPRAVMRAYLCSSVTIHEHNGWNVYIAHNISSVMLV